MNTTFLASLAQGLGNTVVLASLTFLFGGLAGATLALMRISSNRAISWSAILVIQSIQGIPLLVLMGLCFFGPNILGFRGVSPLAAATLAMSIYTAAYMGDIWRGCLQSVARAQWEGAECLGLSKAQRMWYVIAPQAISIAIPPTVGFMVQIVKNTSIASLIVGYPELTYNAKIINNATFEPFLYFGLAGLMYFAVCFPLSELSRAMERKLNAKSN